MFSGVPSARPLRQPAVSAIGAPAGVMEPGGRLTIAAIGTNLRNKRFSRTSPPRSAGGAFNGTCDSRCAWHALVGMK